MGTTSQISSPVIFFDGVCNLCNASVNFIIKRDHAHFFRYTALQSDYAKENLPAYLTEGKEPPSLVLMYQGKLLIKSSAALTIAKHLSGGWPLFYGFMIIPAFIRHFFYDLVAKNRYRLFGRKDQCMIPTPELKGLFID